MTIVDGEALVEEVDHKAGDEPEHGEETTEPTLAASVETHLSHSERISVLQRVYGVSVG